MMSELIKLFLLTDKNRYHDKDALHPERGKPLGRQAQEDTDTSDGELAIRVFNHLDNTFHKHTIDRFASKDNKQLPRYNIKWRDGAAEAVDSLHLFDELRIHEVNWCNPPWPLLDDLAAKLRQSGAAATFITPQWPRFPWFQYLVEMVSKTIEMHPARNLSSPQRQ